MHNKSLPKYDNKKSMEIAQDYCWKHFKVSSNQHVNRLRPEWNLLLFLVIGLILQNYHTLQFVKSNWCGLAIILITEQELFNSFFFTVSPYYFFLSSFQSGVWKHLGLSLIVIT